MNARTRTTPQILGVLAAATLLTGCVGNAQGSQTEASKSPVSSTQSPAKKGPAKKGAPLSTETIAGIFAGIQFQPDAYTSTDAMFTTIYPDVSASPQCREVLGTVASQANDPVTVFGPSIDHTLTGLVSSFGSTGAREYFQKLSASADACIADPQITVASQPIDATITRKDGGGDGENFTLTLVGSATGRPISVIGSVTRFGDDVVIVSGWDPKSNKSNVPRASGMLVERLSTARITRG